MTLAYFQTAMMIVGICTTVSVACIAVIVVFGAINFGRSLNDFQTDYYDQGDLGLRADHADRCEREAQDDRDGLGTDAATEGDGEWAI